MTSLRDDIARLRLASQHALNHPADSTGFTREEHAALARVLEALETTTLALEWYADPKNNGAQEWVEIENVSVAKLRPIDEDEGELARAALSGACMTRDVSSRTCERGTRGCDVKHAEVEHG